MKILTNTLEFALEFLPVERLDQLSQVVFRLGSVLVSSLLDLVRLLDHFGAVFVVGGVQVICQLEELNYSFVVSVHLTDEVLVLLNQLVALLDVGRSLDLGQKGVLFVQQTFHRSSILLQLHVRDELGQSVVCSVPDLVQFVPF